MKHDDEKHDDLARMDTPRAISASPGTASEEWVARDYIGEAHRQAVVEWLLSRGFIRDRGNLVIAWSNRAGLDSATLEFYPLDRHPDDMGWDAIVGCHASGLNPRMVIGRCETLEDVQRAYTTIRLLNGYKQPEEEIFNENAVVPSQGRDAQDR